MNPSIPTVAPGEAPEFCRDNGFAFSDEWDAVELELEQTFLETDRMVTAEDDGSLVGGGAAFSFAMTIPGASLPASGATGVAWRQPIGADAPFRWRPRPWSPSDF